MKSERDLLFDAKEIALKRLNRRECSSPEIYQYLIKKKIPSEIASATVSHFISMNWVSDERYAKLLIRYLAAQGKGPLQMRQKLREKGIFLDLKETQALVEEVTQRTELEAAQELVKRKFSRVLVGKEGKGQRDQKEILRVLQALLRRGFSYSVARKALDCLDDQVSEPSYEAF